MGNRFKPMAEELRGTNVLCVGARLGGEVRAFHRLGALAIGIDFNPGAHNLLVLAGDAHNLQFPDSVFSIVFSNIMDHIMDPRAFFAEAHRVLRPAGTLLLDVSMDRPHLYEVRDLRNAGVEFEQNTSRWFDLAEKTEAKPRLGKKNDRNTGKIKEVVPEVLYKFVRRDSVTSVQ